MIKSLILFSLLIAASALAAPGGWVSSGGELFQFAKNPWFVKNTKEVKYCVVVDKNSVSASEETVREAIQIAVNYWKEEFKTSTPPKAGFADLATQNFILQNSCTDADIQFLIGYGSLDEEQIKYLKAPEKYVGVSVRTSYEEVQMKGSGFVFISSDRGEKAYKNEQKNLVPEAWRFPKLLQYALIHEMGHVFGIPHTGSGLMSEVFLEQLLNLRMVEFYNSNPIQSFVNPPKSFVVCQGDGLFHTGFFQVPAANECLELQGVQNNAEIQWAVSTKEKRNSAAWTPVGVITASLSMNAMAGMKPAVLVQLPPESKVYDLTERLLNSFMIGPVFKEGSAKGFFHTNSSRQNFDLQIELKIDSVTMTGMVGKNLQQVLSYNPPSLFTLLLPIKVGP